MCLRGKLSKVTAPHMPRSRSIQALLDKKIVTERDLLRESTLEEPDTPTRRKHSPTRAYAYERRTVSSFAPVTKGGSVRLPVGGASATTLTPRGERPSLQYARTLTPTHIRPTEVRREDLHQELSQIQAEKLVTRISRGGVSLKAVQRRGGGRQDERRESEEQRQRSLERIKNSKIVSEVTRVQYKDDTKFDELDTTNSSVGDAAEGQKQNSSSDEDFDVKPDVGALEEKQALVVPFQVQKEKKPPPSCFACFTCFAAFKRKR